MLIANAEVRGVIAHLASGDDSLFSYKVEIVVDVMKTAAESDDKGNFARDPVTKKKMGEIYRMLRTTRTNVNSQGEKRKSFVYYYSVQLKEGGGIIDKLEKEQIRKVG